MSATPAGSPTNSVTASGTTHTVNKPTGLADNDVLWLKVNFFNAAFSGSCAGTTITPPTGFTLWQRTDWQGVDGGNATSASTAVYTKLVTSAAGEPSTYSFTLSASSYSEVEAQRFAGCDTSTSTAHRDTQSSNSASNTTTGTFTGVTAARAGSLLIAVDQDSLSATGTTGISPGTWTLLQRFDGNVESWYSAIGAGATGNFTQAWGNANSDWVAQLYVLQPPSAGGGGGTVPKRRALLGVGARHEPRESDRRIHDLTPAERDWWRSSGRRTA